MHVISPIAILNHVFVIQSLKSSTSSEVRGEQSLKVLVIQSSSGRIGEREGGGGGGGGGWRLEGRKGGRSGTTIACHSVNGCP